jgi:phage shock protein A
MELDIKLAYKNALEEITALTDNSIMYKTLATQLNEEVSIYKDKTEKLELQVNELEKRIKESGNEGCNE